MAGRLSELPGAEGVPSLGLSLDTHSLAVASVHEYSAAVAAGVLIGDVVTAVNGSTLRRPPRRALGGPHAGAGGLDPLAAALKDCHVLEGEPVHLSLRRSLQSHMADRLRRRLDDPALRTTVPPDSPRLLPRDRSGAGERRAAWEAAGRPRPPRRPNAPFQARPRFVGEDTRVSVVPF